MRARLAAGWRRAGDRIASPLLLLVAWEAASAAGLLRPQFFPRPTLILGHALDLALDGTLARHAGITLGPRRRGVRARRSCRAWRSASPWASRGACARASIPSSP